MWNIAKMLAYLSCVTLLLAGQALPVYAGEAAAVRYYYDALGRLAGMRDQSGNSVAYRYDAVGNITAIERGGAAQPVILGFTPERGAVGGQVTIGGSGFDATPAGNGVKFNGVKATVIAADGKQIVASVPAGASTGPIQVSTVQGSALSATAFIVADKPPPIITGISPTMGVAGTPVTVSGANFQAALSKASFNGRLAPAQVLNAGSIATSVPAAASSGRIAVDTPYGRALSTVDFFVPPPPLSNVDIETAGRIGLGESRTVNFTAPGKSALLLFDAVEGQMVFISLNAMTLGYCRITVLKPDGSTLISTGCGGSSFTLDPMTMPSTGTYTVFLTPFNNAIGSLVLNVNSVQHLSGAIAIGGPPLTVATTTTGQNADLIFKANAGQRFSVVFSGVSLTNGSYMSASVIQPDGATLAKALLNSLGAFIDVQTAPIPGDYILRLDPPGATLGKVSVQLFDVSADVTANAAIGGPAITVANTSPGQNIHLPFSATAGQRFSIALSGMAFNGNGLPKISVLGPDDATLYAGNAVPPASFVDTLTAPLAGNYLIQIDPYLATVGQLSAQLYDVGADPTLPISIGGSPVAYAFTLPGQGAKLRFTGSAGQSATLHISGSTILCQTISLLPPTGAALASRLYCGSVFNVALPALPADGSYTIGIDPNGAYTGKATATLTIP